MSRPTVDLGLLPGEWLLVDEGAAGDLVAELNREIPEGHELHGQRVEPVARRVKRDDFVWWLPYVHKWAWVHLSYAVERDPRWPSSGVYASFEDLVLDLDDD